MANPYTSAQAPQVSPAMQLIAPDLIAEQLRNARLQQLAQMMREQGMQQNGDTQVINGWAVKKSPAEGISKLAQLLAGTFMQSQADSDNAQIQQKFSNRLSSLASDEQQAPANNSDVNANGAPNTQIGSQAPTPSGNNVIDAYRKILVGQALAGDEGAKLAASRYMPTQMEMESRFMGVSPSQVRDFYLARQTKEGTMSFQPGQTNILPDGSRIVAPDFNAGIAGGFDAQGNPVARPIAGASNTAYDMAYAKSAGEKGAQLMPSDYADINGRPLGMTQREFLQGQSGSAPSAFDVNGAYGTNSKILDNLRSIESGGNPFAINPQTKALGPYQFLPETVAALGKQGIKFNPFDEAQSRAAADYYLSQLIKDSGGDVKKALAKYGGFVNADPTAYVSRALNGVDLSQQPPATSAMGRPQLQSSAEKQAAGAIATKGVDYLSNLDSDVQKSGDLMERYKVVGDALKNITPNAGAEARVNAARVLQGIGMPQNIVDRVANGSLGDSQTVEKLVAQEAIQQLQIALASDSGAAKGGMSRQVIQTFINTNPNIKDDPRALEKLMNLQIQIHREKLDQANAAHDWYKEHGGSMLDFPNYWANQREQSGLLQNKPINLTGGQPALASKAGYQPMTAERWAAMKSGDTFVDAQGNVRRKP